MSLGLYTVPFGKKFTGRKIQDISLNELWEYVTYLETQSAKDGKPLSGKAMELKAKLTEYENLLGAKGETPTWRNKNKAEGQIVGSGAKASDLNAVPW